MKTVITHDWIVDIGGSEKCLESIYSLYPSDVYTLVYKEKSVIDLGLDLRRVHGSFLQKFPWAATQYRNYLPLFPLAVEQFDLSGYDMIISSSHAAAKGVLTGAHQLHICYCYTPMRYAWDLYHHYMSETGLRKSVKGKFAKLFLHYLRIWDHSTAHRVDHFIAISQYIAKRIKKIYGRDSAVIYPPVNVDEFELHSKKDDYYLTASRMVPYKKIDMIVEAFSSMPTKQLVVIGDGPDLDKVKAKAGKNVEVLGRQSFHNLKKYLQSAKAFVFAAEEDFGIITVEAQACGTPVIAFGRGGSRETVLPLLSADAGIQNNAYPYPTGVFFEEQNARALTNAVLFFEKHQDIFNGQRIREHALKFSREIFQREFKKFVDEKLAERR